MNNPSTNNNAAERMQLLLATLGGMAPEEARKAKWLYLRNEMAELQALETTYRSFGFLQLAFAIIPLFWPMLWVQRRTMNASLEMRRARIRNAMEIWRDDLGPDAGSLETEIRGLLT